MIKINFYSLFIALVAFNCFNAYAEKDTDAYELIYEEQEVGTDLYHVKFTVTDHYLRIDQLGDLSGYVIYDAVKHVIHSVSHHDKTVLVIPVYAYQKPDMSKLVNVQYFSMPDVPKISGKTIYSYQVVSSDKNKQKCMDIMLAEDFMPEVTRVFASYQKILAGQQSRLLEATPEEYKNSCFLYDQIFNEGDYYHKGLPIQEWHSNGKSRLLVTYKKVKVDPEIFRSEESYEKYSLD